MLYVASSGDTHLPGPFFFLFPTFKSGYPFSRQSGTFSPPLLFKVSNAGLFRYCGVRLRAIPRPWSACLGDTGCSCRSLVCSPDTVIHNLRVRCTHGWRNLFTSLTTASCAAVGGSSAHRFKFTGCFTWLTQSTYAAACRAMSTTWKLFIIAGSVDNRTR